MVDAKKRIRNCYIYAALWGVPGILTLIEAYRLSKSPKFQNVSFTEGPVGYMSGVGLLLMGFSLGEIILSLRHTKEEVQHNVSNSSGITRKGWITIAYMIIFLLLLPLLGFILASGCFLFGSLLLLGCTLKVVAVTVFVYCGTLYFIVPYLGLSLPKGMLGI